MSHVCRSAVTTSCSQEQAEKWLSEARAAVPDDVVVRTNVSSTTTSPTG